MIIQCPECRTKYKVPDDKAKPEGTPVRCSKCKNVFKIYPESPAEEAAGEVVRPTEAPREEEERAVSSDSVETTEGSFEAEHGREDFRDEQEKIPAEAPSASGRKGLRIVLVFLLLICGGAGAALYLYPDLPRQIMDMATGTSEQPAVSRQADQAEKGFTKVALEGVKQYFVKNEKVGQLFVLEGKAVNNTKAAVQNIVVEATLFDSAGARVVADRTSCGTTVSLFQLQILDKEGLTGALKTEPVETAPGSSVPFMIVFQNPPQQVQEFGVEVVEVK